MFNKKILKGFILRERQLIPQTSAVHKLVCLQNDKSKAVIMLLDVVRDSGGFCQGRAWATGN
jgi:hypothetical protein